MQNNGKSKLIYRHTNYLNAMVTCDKDEKISRILHNKIHTLPWGTCGS